MSTAITQGIRVSVKSRFLPEQSGSGRYAFAYTVRIENDGAKALATAREFAPDLILLDLIMPEVDGFAVLEGLRSEASETFLPIVILTADITEEAKARALEAGATDFLVKPVSQTEALLRIRNLLETRRLHLVLENQRAALEDAVRERTAELRGTIAELQAVNQHPQGSSAFSNV